MITDDEFTALDASVKSVMKRCLGDSNDAITRNNVVRRLKKIRKSLGIDRDKVIFMCDERNNISKIVNAGAFVFSMFTFNGLKFVQRQYVLTPKGLDWSTIESV